jgi:hypothetical protein
MGLDTRYPNKGVKFLEMNAYRELYREYLTNSLVFMIDSHPVELKNVKVVMNSAKADGQFISPRFETSGNVIYIECNAYGDLPDHRTFLTVKNGTWMQRDTLNSSNDFGIQFTVNQTSE